MTVEIKKRDIKKHINSILHFSSLPTLTLVPPNHNFNWKISPKSFLPFDLILVKSMIA